MRITAKAKIETRQRILDAARNLFSDKGFAGTTTRDIAVEASIATGTLFNYFPGKEQLALAIIDISLESAHREFLTSQRDNESLEEALFSHIAIMLRHLRPHRGYLGDVVETTLSPFNQSDDDDASANLRVRHLETVQSLIEAHATPASPQPSAVIMHLYWTLYLGVLAYWAKDESPNQEDTLVLMDHALRLFVNSLDISLNTLEPNRSS